MSEKKNIVLIRVIISIGILCFIVNSVFFYLSSKEIVINTILFFGLIFQILLGLLIFVIPVSYEKKGYQLYIGFILAGWGLLNCIFAFIYPVNVHVWWPLYLIISSIFLFITGLIKYKKFKFGYVIPGVTLLCMGIWYSLFSFDIVKIPFRVIVFALGPGFIVLIGLFFVLFFLAQQRHKKLVFHDENSGDFDDEELTFPKLD